MQNSGKVKIVLTDVVFLLLLFITAAYVIEMLPKKGMPMDSSYIVSIKWDDNSVEDIDLHVKDPLQAHVYYRNREAGFMHLDQDDLGEANDTILDDEGNRLVHKKNVEKVEIRSAIPGIYIANIHKYKGQEKPTKVLVTIYQSTHGQVSELAKRELVLVSEWEEKTAFQFELNELGAVNRINYDYFSLIQNI